MKLIQQEGKGAIIYLRQEGRGIGLHQKLHAYHLQDQGFDTVDANLELGLPVDRRDYGVGAQTDARNVATLLGLDAPKNPDPYLKPGHIRVTLATDYSLPAQDETTDESTTTTTSSKASSYGYWSTSTYPTPDPGKPIDGGGVPCVN